MSIPAPQTMIYEVCDRVARITLNRMTSYRAPRAKDGWATTTSRARRWTRWSWPPTTTSAPWDPMVDHPMMGSNVRGFMSLFHANKPVVCKVYRGPSTSKG